MRPGHCNFKRDSFDPAVRVITICRTISQLFMVLSAQMLSLTLIAMHLWRLWVAILIMIVIFPGARFTERTGANAFEK